MIQVTNELCLKAIAWDTEKNVFASPSHSEFKWSRDGIEKAVCGKCHVQEEPPYGDNSIPGEDCLCGLYGTFRWNIIASGYTRQRTISPVVLVEANGKSILYDDGIRSYQQGIVAVIDTWAMIQFWIKSRGPSTSQYKKQGFNITQISTKGITASQPAALQAVDYFQVPMLDWQTATIVMDLQNIKLNPPWEKETKFKYVPESSDVRAMKHDQLRTTIETYLPSQQQEEESLAWELFASR